MKESISRILGKRREISESEPTFYSREFDGKEHNSDCPTQGQIDAVDFINKWGDMSQDNTEDVSTTIQLQGDK